MKDRKISLKEIETIEDLKPELVEQKVDFHARLPISQRDRLLKAAQEKGVYPNIILRKALEAYGV